MREDHPAEENNENLPCAGDLHQHIKSLLSADQVIIHKTVIEALEYIHVPHIITEESIIGHTHNSTTCRDCPHSYSIGGNYYCTHQNILKTLKPNE